MLLPLPIENTDSLSCRASRRPETFLSTGQCVSTRVSLQLKLCKCGRMALSSGGMPCCGGGTGNAVPFRMLRMGMAGVSQITTTTPSWS